MGVNERSVRRGRWAFALSVLALSWAVALIPAAFLVPVYAGAGETVYSPAQGAAITTSQTLPSSTLIAENGASVRLLAVLALPAALAALAWFGLHRKCTRTGVAGARIAAFALGLLSAFAVVTGLSIGGFVLPVVVLLAIAAILTPTHS